MIDRTTKISLVLPPEPTPIEEFAGEELARYLGQALGVKVSQGEADIRFVLGGPHRNPAAAALMGKEEFSQKVGGSEGYAIRITDTEVLLAGGAEPEGWDRGTLYAVYEFLEEYVGCSFGAYTHPDVLGGEFVPTLSELALPTGDKTVMDADLPYRTAIVQFEFWAGNARRGLTLPFIDWLAKNRYNRILTWVSCYEEMMDMGLEKELLKRGIRLAVGHHQAIATWLPYNGNQYFDEAYGQTHPEYYRLNADGSRFVPKKADDYNGQWVLCSRNEACVQQTADNICKWLEKNPVVDTVAFWPFDGKAEQCCCEQCAPYSIEENYLYFENELARRIGARFPYVKIDVLIYQNLQKCPQDIVLGENLRIDQANWDRKGLRSCGKPDGSGFLGTRFEENLLPYCKRSKHVVCYEYYMGNYDNRQSLMPAADEMQSIFRAFRELGIEGSGTQMECFNSWNNLFNFYTFARTAYDTSLSMEKAMERFCRLFGEGGEQVRDILFLYENTLDGQVPISETGKFVMEHIDHKVVYELFDKALAATKDAVCRNNLRLLRMVFRYSHLISIDGSTERHIKQRMMEDPTGELAYMATHFDSYYANETGYGIAIPVSNRTDAAAPNIWYQFD